MHSPKRRQYKHTKSRYRVRNWSEYEVGLTVWLSEEALHTWRAAPSDKPGGQRRYADIAIEAALAIRMVFHLPLRQTEGFLRSVAELLDVDLPIPDHTTPSRRLQKLGEIQFSLPRVVRSICSSTAQGSGFTSAIAANRPEIGHGASYTWESMRRAARSSPPTLTGHHIRDSTPMPVLLAQIDHPVASICADGAYDRESVYEAAQSNGGGQAARVLIPPPRDARLRSAPSTAMRERNRNVRAMRDLGRREWHKQSGYCRRSMVENTIHRFKTILGRNMRSRSMEGQRSEVQIGCKILNRMVLLGMPDSCKAD